MREYRLSVCSAAAAACLLALPVLQGCGMVVDDPVECPAKLEVSFVYDYNIKFADAFRHEVKSVNIWAFDSETGKLVWNAEAKGDALGQDGFSLDAGLPEGTYDFVTWCGLADNPGFELATFVPESKKDLKVHLNTVAEDGLTVSRRWLPGIYNATRENVEYKVNPYAPTHLKVEMPLMKDTKSIRVMLQHTDGSAIQQRDFSCTITTADAELDWDNSLLPSPTVTYRPFETRYGQTNPPGEQAGAQKARTISTVSSLLFDLSTSRLDLDRGATLTIRRDWDNTVLLDINLLDYLLLVKGHYGDIGDQEYLDRQDDYSIVFFIDADSNWYLANGIFINDWAVVPPQDETIQ